MKEGVAFDEFVELLIFAMVATSRLARGSPHALSPGATGRQSTLTIAKNLPDGLSSIMGLYSSGTIHMCQWTACAKELQRLAAPHKARRLE